MKYFKKVMLLSFLFFFSVCNCFACKNYLVLFAGEAASGKTFVANALSKNMKCRRFSVSDYLKEIANLKKLDSSDRSVLQFLGTQQIALGWHDFVENFIKFTQWNKTENLIIDGVRHKEFFDEIKQLCPAVEVRLVFVKSDRDVQVKRFLKLGGKLEQLCHEVESHYCDLEKVSDYILQCNERNAKDIIDELSVNLFKYKRGF